jgi:hypothetical protein
MHDSVGSPSRAVLGQAFQEDTLLDAGSEKQENRGHTRRSSGKETFLSKARAQDAPRKLYKMTMGGTDYVTAFRQRRKTRYDRSM